MFRFGEPIKREYRGIRSVESLVSFVRRELEDPVNILSSADEMLNYSDKYTIGFFESPESSDYGVYRRVAGVLRDDCQFYAVFRNKLLEHEPDVVHFIEADRQTSLSYSGRIGDYTELLEWSKDNCILFVREVTFKNAEELTEEGLPMLILFHHLTDVETPLRFRKFVAAELMSERHEMIFLTADGLKFSHPLEHLARSADDLSVIAIDTFKHMYLWNHNPKTDLSEPGLIKQFIVDLHSGNLHREFHEKNPRHLKPATPKEERSRHVVKDSQAVHHRFDAERNEESTSPPKSTFIKLAPSSFRYTLVRDEL